MLLAIADNAHDDGAQAWPSMTTLVRKTGLAERTVQGALNTLVDLGELEVNHNAGPRHCNLYRVLMVAPAPDAPPQEMHPAGDAGVQEMHPTPAGDAPPPPQEMHPEPSIEPSRNRQVRALSVVPTDEPVHDPERAVFDAWVATLEPGTSRKLTAERRGKIRTRLRNFPASELIEAVQGWPNDPWTDRAQHNDLGILLRTDAQVEKFRDLYRKGPPLVMGKRTAEMVRNAQGMRVWAEQMERDGSNGTERMGTSRRPAQRELPRPAD